METKLSSILINMNKCLNMFDPIGEDLSVSYLTFNILQILVFVEGFPTIFRAALLIYSWRRKCQMKQLKDNVSGLYKVYSNDINYHNLTTNNIDPIYERHGMREYIQRRW